MDATHTQLKSICLSTFPLALILMIFAATPGCCVGSSARSDSSSFPPSPPLFIDAHFASPSIISNCTNTTITCRLSGPLPLPRHQRLPQAWWSHNPRGNNATELPRVTVLSPSYSSSSATWRMSVACATLVHAGKYTCHVVVQTNASNVTTVLRNKDVNLEVFVPMKIEIEEKETVQSVNKKVYLSCRVLGYPKPRVEWYKDGKVLVVQGKDHGRVTVSTTDINGSTVHGTVMINSLVRSDNGTYTCTAVNAYNTTSTDLYLVVQEPPDVQIEPNAVIESHKVWISWYVTHTGNLPVKEFIVQHKKSDDGWSEQGHSLLPDQHNYTIEGLKANIGYDVRVAATNSVGQGPWNTIHINTPAGIPSKALSIIKVSSSNSSLLFKWERPSEDNGSNLTHFIMQLYRDGSLYDEMVKNGTDLNRRHFMSLWNNLDAGESFTFKVIACNAVGCGPPSDPGVGSTKDGFSEAPVEVRLRCLHDNISMTSYVVVSWKPPSIPRGSINGYSVYLEGVARYRDITGKILVDHIPEVRQLNADVTEFRRRVKSNTNYTVKVCARTGAGCGSASMLTKYSVCTTPPNVPRSLPRYSLRRIIDQDERTKLMIEMKRVSERNGNIRCYRVIMIKLGAQSNIADLPPRPRSVQLSTYFSVHGVSHTGAYIAEEVLSSRFVEKVIIGDDMYTRCDSQDFSRSKRSLNYVHDGKLAANTNYSGFIQVVIHGPAGLVLTQQSDYFTPISTGHQRFNNSNEDSMTVILGSVFGILLALLLLLLGICFYRRYKMQVFARDEYGMGMSAFSRRNGHIANQPEKLPIIEPILAEELPAAFLLRHKDTDLIFQTEFELLPERFKDRTTHASDAPENALKNRYPDIKAYDQTRVKMHPIDGITGSDYINANFVQGYKGIKKFICAQGPIDKTVDDFWRMIWQHRIYVIIMLTDFEEHGKVKCSRYWSEEGQKQYGNISVAVSQYSKFSEYAVRKLLVESKMGNVVESSREILHFHFLMWKDFLAPDQPSWLLRFIKRVNENYCNDRGPMLIHCSAGVGRTGTFVAIDTLLQMMEEHGQIDIFTCIANLRKERNYLVQSLKQYIFVYRALMEHAQFGDTEIEVMTLREYYDQLKCRLYDDKFKTKLDREYEKLSEVIENPKSHSVGVMEINKCKNRYDSILPYDVNRVILPPVPSRDQSSYINASLIQGYDRSPSYIITQDPLDNTRWDFWRMVKEQGVHTIVMLSEIGHGQTQCQTYWAEQEQQLQYDQLSVKLTSTDVFTAYNKRYFVVSSTKSNNELKVTQYQFKCWTQGSDTPQNTSSFLDLITQVQLSQDKTDTVAPLLVHCSGGERCSVYISLSILIQQMKTEQRLDVFQVARNIRAQRSHMLMTVNQYEFLYKALLDYIESFTLCDTQL